MHICIEFCFLFILHIRALLYSFLSLISHRLSFQQYFHNKHFTMIHNVFLSSTFTSFPHNRPQNPTTMLYSIRITRSSLHQWKIMTNSCVLDSESCFSTVISLLEKRTNLPSKDENFRGYFVSLSANTVFHHYALNNYFF